MTTRIRKYKDRKLTEYELDQVNSMIIKDELTGCWNWTGKMDTGIPYFKGKRLTKVFFSDKLLKGYFINRQCKNIRCVNDDHMILRSTHKAYHPNVDNMEGIRNPMHKLTELQVEQIFGDKRSSRKIAKDFGVEKTTVLNIKKGKVWKHLNL